MSSHARNTIAAGLAAASLLTFASCGKKEPAPAPARKPVEPAAADKPLAKTPEPAPSKDVVDVAGSAGSAANEPSHMIEGITTKPGAPINRGDKGAIAAALKRMVMSQALPAGWTREDDEYGAAFVKVVAVNESKFPVDNAEFRIRVAPITCDDECPTRGEDFGSYTAQTVKDSVKKTEPRGTAVYYEAVSKNESDEGVTYDEGFYFAYIFNGAPWTCGGSLYRDKDFDKIPKIRAAALKEATAICESITVPAT